MDLPVMPPVAPMLAKLQDDIPVGDGWLYEPKWDGFRAIVFRDGTEIHIASRDKRPLERYFPELIEPLAQELPDRCVVDGEIVVSSPEGLDFDALLLRIHPAESRVKTLSAKIPATFIAFDLLALDNDLQDSPAVVRRTHLVESLREASTSQTPKPSQVLVTPQTDDIDQGREWFEGLEALGLDGLIAKRADSPYSPGKRTMIKIKHRRTADCVVGGYRLSKDGDGVGSLLLGLYDNEDNLHYVGHTSSFKAQERRDLLALMTKIHGDGGFGQGRTPGGPSRWTSGKDVSWISVDPVLVCEVAYDHMQGERFRHAATFQRWRDDKAPSLCTFDQL